MSHEFFDYDTLTKGAPLMAELIKQCYSKTEGQVFPPNIQPGFLRNQLPKHASEDGKPIQYLLEQTKNVIFPGIMNWQSPKFFGLFPSSINVTSILAQMFASTFQTPAFSFHVSPSHTELENVVVDWVALALALPDKFLLKNSGGGIINNSATESVFVSVHAAKYRKMKELGIEGNNPDVLKFVGYYGDIAHICGHRALLVKDIYYRKVIPCYYNKETKNYEPDEKKFIEIIEKDLADGLIPFWVGATYGSTFSGAIDLTPQLVEIAKKYKMWLQIDAAYLGSTWICPEYRPDIALLEAADSLVVNLSKVLLSGTGGSFMFISDKKELTQSFGASLLQFSFYKNKFSDEHDTVDYKDWTIGLARRNNSIKLYYTLEHYGLKKLRAAIENTSKKAQFLRKLISNHPDLFQIYTQIFGIITFQLKANNAIDQPFTRHVAGLIKNIKEGYCSPAEFKGDFVIRIVIGNFHITQKQIEVYFNKIREVTKEELAKWKTEQK